MEPRWSPLYIAGACCSCSLFSRALVVSLSCVSLFWTAAKVLHAYNGVFWCDETWTSHQCKFLEIWLEMLHCFVPVNTSAWLDLRVIWKGLDGLVLQCCLIAFLLTIWTCLGAWWRMVVFCNTVFPVDDYKHF
jgi:hypothetical protein